MQQIKSVIALCVRPFESSLMARLLMGCNMSVMAIIRRGRASRLDASCDQVMDFRLNRRQFC
ncbi:hypothetical protein BJF95_11590 [Rhizobium oryziradicis]|uniref:Uncharacterized protein n=1 Tax=Rhizobium oryziradicis TaxID=1867956 RepID=A0A1Q8ZUT7_9HYPH|nr:hypothetical protein BJF95_11590 [Rhizobium oryziradicis]